MKTEIDRSFKSGFVLTEQELRRIIQACTEHAEKASTGQPFATAIQAVLRDGSIIEFDGPDDLFALENAGSKSIRKVSVNLTASVAPAPWSISVLFQDASANNKDWVAISFVIKGESRDWAFLTASDLEDRIKRTKTLSFEGLLSSKYAVVWIVLLSTLTFAISLDYVGPARDSHVLLQQQVDSGQIHEPVQAIIALEKIRNERSSMRELYPMFVGLGVPLAILAALAFLVPKVNPSYNFYWGDYVAYYDRRKQIRKIIWTAIVLALIVTVLGNFISKKMGM